MVQAILTFMTEGSPIPEDKRPDVTARNATILVESRETTTIEDTHRPERSHTTDDPLSPPHFPHTVCPVRSSGYVGPIVHHTQRVGNEKTKWLPSKGRLERLVVVTEGGTPS